MSACAIQLNACRMRVARLEPNGVPDPGANNLIISDALSVLTLTPRIQAGTETVVKNGCGAVLASRKETDRYSGWDVALTIVRPDPYLHELLAGGVVLTDGTKVGYGAPNISEDATPNGVSIEIWVERVDESGDLDADDPYGWWVLPRARMRLDNREHKNAAHESPFVGHLTENPNWYNGPLNDWPSGLITETDRPWFWLPTDSIPDATCGRQTLAAS